MKKSILFIFTACFLFTTSCSDFLDEEHKTKYSSEYVFGTTGRAKTRGQCTICIANATTQMILKMPPSSLWKEVRI